MQGQHLVVGVTADEVGDRCGELGADDTSQCTTNVNQTESIRLDNELRGWFKVEPAEKAVKRKPTKAPYKKPTTYPVGNVVKSPPNSLTGSVYHMLIQVMIQS